MSSVMSPASADEALEMLTAALGYLAAADATAMTAAEQARCLRVLERATSAGTAARTSVLGAFASGRGYSAAADYSPRAWLTHKTGVSKGAAVAYTAWVRRAEEHPRVLAALATGDLPESVARIVCQWANRLPEDARDAADDKLVAAALAGMCLPDLAGLFGEIYEQARSEFADEDTGEVFDDRAVRLITTFAGAGVMTGDLTPECAEAVAAVLDALSAPAGADDDRSREQRCHDALQEAMSRLIAAGILPERAGQPVKVWAHISLADLLRLDGSSALQEEWTAQVRARWAGHRAAASEGGGDSGAWLDGDAAGAAIEQAVIGKAVDLLSGPGGLASFLRRRQLGVRLSGPSLPLDIGYSESIPAGIRNAVTLRDRHCQWAGRCDQPASACQVHHTRHKANGGPTSVKDCVLLCWFHHQVVIHRWGWTLVLNPDGTTTAWNKDKTKDLAKLDRVRRSETW